jgi:hypothetical protein
VAVPLLKPLEHSPKKLALILETGGQVVHVGVGRLALEPYLGIRPAVGRGIPSIKCDTVAPTRSPLTE